MQGTRIAHYLVLEQIGSGGMGVVYLARDEKLARNVALKFIAPAVSRDAHARARLMREARAACAIDHPNIATVHDVGEWEGQLFLAMGYYPGETLKDRIARGPLAIDEAVAIAEQIAAGLDAAHAASVVHRDLKPGNVILTPSGLVKILDFGLAKLRGPSVETATDVTGAGTTVGTMLYMAPEQARGEEVDQAADVWAFGVVLFEMLTRRLPFPHESAAALLAAILTRPPAESRSIRPEIPSELDRLIARCLVKDPAKRTLTASEAARLIAEYRGAIPGGATRRSRRRAALLAAAAILVAAALLAPLLVRASHRRWAARTALPEIQRLVAAQENGAALDLATESERYLQGDATLAAILPTIARPLTIESEPAGAQIAYKEYGKESDWRPLGRTPIRDARLPIGWLRVRAVKEGFDTAEDAVGNIVGPGGVTTTRFELASTGSAPAGMVRAIGTPSPYSVYVLGLELPRVTLAPFWIDREEVTNREFKAFVDANGYGRRELWQAPFIRDGREIAWDAAMALFHDATGRPGPAAWELGNYPEGQDDLPVTGISWFEAAAYAAFVGHSLPTVYHWSWVATQPLVGSVIPFANFNSRALVPAGTATAVHRFGAVNLAGNVKEWCANESKGGKRYILGGGFDEPPYMFSDADARSPFERSANFGFRTTKLDAGDASGASLAGPIVGPLRDYTSEKPVGDPIFGAYLRMYSYDPTDLAATVEPEASTSPDWRMEKVTFSAAYPDERVIVHLFLPTRATPPFHVVLFVPPANAWDQRSSEALRASPSFAYLVRSGRAVALPIYQGTFERGTDDFRSDFKKNTSRWRDHVIALSKDFRRTVDYLVTRQDVDTARLGFLGISRGASLSPMLLALEPRIHAAALWIPGLYLEPVPAEADAINFVTRVKTPTLVLSGRYDYNFPDDTSARPFFDLLGAAAEDKRRVVYDTGHNLPFADAVKQTLDWFDRYLGRPAA
jgi:tRNA A-37 threonylcarbamoyl transferase component Bud32/dienelactone hydrolase